MSSWDLPDPPPPFKEATEAIRWLEIFFAFYSSGLVSPMEAHRKAMIFGNNSVSSTWLYEASLQEMQSLWGIVEGGELYSTISTSKWGRVRPKLHPFISLLLIW